MTSEAGPTTGERPPVSAVYRLEPGEYLAAVRTLSRRSKASIGIGVFALGVGILSFAIGLAFQDPVTFVTNGVVPIVFGVALVTGWYCVPFCWYTMRKRPDLFNAEMSFEMDDSGLRFRTAMVDSRVTWPYVRRVRDLGQFLFFDSGAGANLFVPERAFDGPSLAILLRVLVERGLLPA